jgi:hypothetical protein
MLHSISRTKRNIIRILEKEREVAKFTEICPGNQCPMKEINAQSRTPIYVDPSARFSITTGKIPYASALSPPRI